jgi:hypothetical protein
MLELVGAVDVVAIFRVLFVVWLVLKLLELLLPEAFQPCPPDQQQKIGGIIRKVFGPPVRKEEREEEGEEGEV